MFSTGQLRRTVVDTPSSTPTTPSVPATPRSAPEDEPAREVSGAGRPIRLSAGSFAIASALNLNHKPFDFRTEITPLFRRYYSAVERGVTSIKSSVSSATIAAFSRDMKDKSSAASAPAEPRASLSDDDDYENDFFLDPIFRGSTKKKAAKVEEEVAIEVLGGGSDDEGPTDGDGNSTVSVPSLARYMESHLAEAEIARSIALKRKGSSNSLTSLFNDRALELNPNSYPNNMLVTVEKVEVGKPRPLLLRVVFRGRKLRPLNSGTESITEYIESLVFGQSAPQHFNAEVYQTGLTFHSIIFDTLKVDVYERSTLLTTHIGRARIRLKDLPTLCGSVVESFPLHPRRIISSEPPVIGNITISFDFSHTAEDDEEDPVTPVWTDSQTDSIHPDDSASVMGEIGDPELGSNFGSQVGSSTRGLADNGSNSCSNISNIAESIRSKAEIAVAREAVAQEFMGYFNSEESVSQSPDRAIVTSPTLAQSFMSVYSNSKSLSARILSPHNNHSASSSLSSHNTKLSSLKELSNIAAAFFNQGWRVSKLEFARAILLVARWQSTIPPIPIVSTLEDPQQPTSSIITSTEEIRVATHFARFAMAAYGSVVSQPVWWEASRVYVRDFLRVRDDRRTARDALGVTKSDMVEWEFGPSDERFKPKFFVCWDSKSHSLVCVIRGTVNIADLVTDLCAEYESYRSGYAHRGILRCARWLHDHLLPRLKKHIVERKARALYVVGHSLGAAIASVFTMLVRDSEFADEVDRFGGRLVDEETGADVGGAFRIHCFSYACPPCLSADLSDGLIGWVDSFVNQDDMVPRMSYGSMIDLREVLIRAAEIGRSGRGGIASEAERFEALSAHLKHLQSNNVHPKAFVPGTIYHIRRTTSANTQSAVASPPESPLVSPTSPTSTNDAACDRDHMVIERTFDRNRFGTVIVKMNMLYHHFPNRYESALWEAHDWLIAQSGK